MIRLFISSLHPTTGLDFILLAVVTEHVETEIAEILVCVCVSVCVSAVFLF